MGQGMTLYNLGEAYRRLRSYEEAIDHLEESLTACREVGYRWLEGMALQSLGLALQDLKNVETARACWRKSLEIFAQIDAIEADNVRALLES